MTKQELYSEVISVKGCNHQLIVAIEELSELQKELTKYLRHKGDVNHIQEEMADVLIVLDELKMIFNRKGKVEEFISYKLERLHQRLHQN